VPSVAPLRASEGAVTAPVYAGDVAHNAGDVTNTSLVSDPKLTGVADEPDIGVVRVSVGPVVLYVPSPTSQVPNVCDAIQ